MTNNSEQLAKRFHDTYERLAPNFGYETREDTKSFDPESPNGKLMIAVCSELFPEQLNTQEWEWQAELRMLDFPTAWRLAKMSITDNHHENCSYRTTNGAMLCDCVGVEMARYARMDLESLIFKAVSKEREEGIKNCNSGRKMYELGAKEERSRIIEILEKTSDFADSGETLKKRIINQIKVVSGEVTTD